MQEDNCKVGCFKGLYVYDSNCGYINDGLGDDLGDDFGEFDFEDEGCCLLIDGDEYLSDFFS